ncbi:MAG: DUF1572 domain-containing protein [Maribacter sp.]|nr:DUF1572 domain-containing protein [Maribacter sp.]
MNLDKILVREFIENSVYRLDENTRMINTCLEELSEDEIWLRPNTQSNSVANLILHLCGNITQYAISSLGQKTDVRERDQEFAIQSGYTKSEVIQKLTETVAMAKTIIKNAPIEQIVSKRLVQGFDLSGIGIIVHVVEHYSYHTGQIVFWVKQLKNKDLGFYNGIDLTIKNKG